MSRNNSPDTPASALHYTKTSPLRQGCSGRFAVGLVHSVSERPIRPSFLSCCCNDPAQRSVGDVGPRVGPDSSPCERLFRRGSSNTGLWLSKGGLCESERRRECAGCRDYRGGSEEQGSSSPQAAASSLEALHAGSLVDGGPRKKLYLFLLAFPTRTPQCHLQNSCRVRLNCPAVLSLMPHAQVVDKGSSGRFSGSSRLG